MLQSLVAHDSKKLVVSRSCFARLSCGLVLFCRHKADLVVGRGHLSKVGAVELPNFVPVASQKDRVNKFSPVMSEERRPDGLLAKHAYSVLQAWIATRG